MHAAGAVASKIAPFGVLSLVGLERHYMTDPLIPGWSLWAVLAIGVVQILTDVVWSTRKSDWKKYRREKALASGGG
jgi:hypothetical protein